MVDLPANIKNAKEDCCELKNGYKLGLYQLWKTCGKLFMKHEILWKKAKEGLKSKEPPHAYSTWFEPINSIAMNKTSIICIVPI